MDSNRRVTAECPQRWRKLIPPEFLELFAAPSRVLGVKGKILSIDLPHELRAKFDILFELLFGLAL